MTSKSLRRICGLMLAGSALVCASAACPAQTYAVSVDTSPLHGQGTYFMEFQLTDGSPAGGNANAQAAISNFLLTGGTLGSALPTLGNVEGTLADNLTLTDGPASFGSVADFAQGFSVTGSTSQLRFDLNLAAMGLEAPNPDRFSFLILDAAQMALPTTAPTSAELVGADFIAPFPTPLGYATTGLLRLQAVVSLRQGTTVPEPATWLQLCVGTATVAALWKRRRRCS